MNKILALLLLSLPQVVWARCAPVNEKEVIVMYDSNFSYTEVLAAEKAACKRGQKLIVLPGGIEAHKKAGKIHRDFNYITTRLKSCKTKAQCEPLLQKAYDIQAKLQNEVNNAIAINPDQTAAFSALAKDKIKIKSLIISGHNGGGHFGGYLGIIGKHQIIESYNKAYENLPEERKELESVYLWGCYTSTLDEVNQWRTGIPSLKLIAGFHASGPSIGKDATRDVLEDLLTKEASVLEKNKSQEISRSLRNINNINQTLAAIYLKACDNTDYYYSIKESKKQSEDGRMISDGRIIHDFSRLEDLPCQGEEFLEYHKLWSAWYQLYIYGEREIPEDTSGGMLRHMYNFVRENAHCISEAFPGSSLEANHIGLLLFFNKVKKGFPRFFENKIKLAQSELDQMPQDQKEKHDFWLPTATKLEAASRPEILVNLSRMDKYLSDPTFEDPEMRRKSENLFSMKNAMETYLFRLDSNCMNMLDWYNTAENGKPAFSDNCEKP